MADLGVVVDEFRWMGASSQLEGCCKGCKALDGVGEESADASCSPATPLVLPLWKARRSLDSDTEVAFHCSRAFCKLEFGESQSHESGNLGTEPANMLEKAMAKLEAVKAKEGKERKVKRCVKNSRCVRRHSQRVRHGKGAGAGLAEADSILGDSGSVAPGGFVPPAEVGLVGSRDLTAEYGSGKRLAVSLERPRKKLEAVKATELAVAGVMAVTDTQSEVHADDTSAAVGVACDGRLQPNASVSRARANLEAAKARQQFQRLTRSVGIINAGASQRLVDGASGGVSLPSDDEPRVSNTRRKSDKRRRAAKDAETGLHPAKGEKRGKMERAEGMEATDSRSARGGWIPPVSTFGLIQEQLYMDPWKTLVACILLNKTGGRQMNKVIWDLFELCPTPESAVGVSNGEIGEIIRPLGLQNKRARAIQRFSAEYLQKDWKDVTELYGIGKYASDAHAIFCEGRWRDVNPDDHMLKKYWKWLWATQGQGYGYKTDV